MALKCSHVLVTILCLVTLVLLLFREFSNFKSKYIINAKQISTIATYSSSSSSSQYHNPLISRKVLASNFDFTPFLNHHHHHDRRQQVHHNKDSPDKKQQQEKSDEPSAGGDDHQSEIDPRYGVEKRRVPTGPNPLHH